MCMRKSKGRVTWKIFLIKCNTFKVPITKTVKDKKNMFKIAYIILDFLCEAERLRDVIEDTAMSNNAVMYGKMSLVERDTELVTHETLSHSISS